MQKLRLLSFALLALNIAWSAHADEKRYISDNLTAYAHSGPGNQYRIVGTLNAGEAVTLHDVNNASNFAQVVDSKGRSIWLPQDQLSETPSLRIQVPALQQQVDTLTGKLKNIDDSWNKRTAEMQQKVATSDDIITKLQKENQDLKNQLIVASKKVDAANIQLDDKQRTIILQWFMYGGGVAGFGLLLGLLLPRIIPRRKKDRWMR
jgi:SH3 domain protein